VNKAQPDLQVLQGQLVQPVLLVQQELRELPDHVVQQVLMVQTVPMALMELLVLRDQQEQLELQAQQELRVQQEQLALMVQMELMVQLQPLLLAQLQPELLAAVQALLTAVAPLLLFSTSQFLGEPLVQQALKVQQVQTLLLRWEQPLSAQEALQQEPSVTTPQKTGLRATTVVSG